MAKGRYRLVAETPKTRLGTTARGRPEERTKEQKELSLSRSTVPSGETREGQGS